MNARGTRGVFACQPSGACAITLSRKPFFRPERPAKEVGGRWARVHVADRLFLFPRRDSVALAGQGRERVERVRDAVARVVSREGYELVDVELTKEMGRNILRLYIDTIPPGTKERGVTV